MILRLKRTPGLYLVGFMASGKSTLGRMLAEHIGWKFADLDHDIERSENQQIGQIFDERGEPEFRRIEHAVMAKHIRDVECGRPIVLALGGGAFVQPENFALLENNGVTLWIDCPFEIVERRVHGDRSRPLARDPIKLRELHDQRREGYALADFRIDCCSEDPEENLRAVLSLSIFK